MEGSNEEYEIDLKRASSEKETALFCGKPGQLRWRGKWKGGVCQRIAWKDGVRHRGKGSRITLQ